MSSFPPPCGADVHTEAYGQGQMSGARDMLTKVEEWARAARASDGAAVCTAHRVLDVLDAFLARERAALGLETAAAPATT